MESMLAAFILLATGYVAGGVKIINQSNQALVERLGKYQKTLDPGINWIAPILDTIVWEDTVREQFLEVDEQQALTRDNVALKVKTVVYWKILELRDAYYTVDNVQEAIKNRVTTALGAAIGRRELDQAVSSRDEINKELLRHLDEETEGWGVKITRVDVQNLLPSATVIESMEQERAAEIEKRAEILQAEGTGEYLRAIARALASEDTPPTSQEMLHFLLTDRYVEAVQKLSESDNAKIVFMDPKAINEALEPVMGGDLASMPKVSGGPKTSPNLGKN